MTFIDWLQERQKALVPLVMVGIYFVNKYYGWDIPLSQDDIVLILGAVISVGVHQIPNKVK